ncbi:hypothetical protein BDN72DRAFT_345756 [Pluteus cervinus]|uniref:Uncharacterized protein n=1 Tax=Pluteus cervinus TaxID=181527 RepID=A0ACD3AC84_9AGAR|nr:hypothetical protein BDN72DRAFT_345756 [Pluteus cervinus]
MHITAFSNALPLSFFCGITIPNTTRDHLDVKPVRHEEMPSESLQTIQNCRSKPWKSLVLVITTEASQVSRISLKVYKVARAAMRKSNLHFTFASTLLSSMVVNPFLDLSSLTTLDISAEASQLAIPFWSHTLGQLPRLRTLKARKHIGLSLVQSLFYEISAMDQTQSSPLSFRALRVLALEGCHFDKDPGRLICVLSARITRGCHRLRRLVFYTKRDHKRDNRREGVLQKRFAHLVDSVERLAHSEF